MIKPDGRPFPRITVRRYTRLADTPPPSNQAVRHTLLHPVAYHQLADPVRRRVLRVPSTSSLTVSLC